MVVKIHTNVKSYCRKGTKSVLIIIITYGLRTVNFPSLWFWYCAKWFSFHFSDMHMIRVKHLLPMFCLSRLITKCVWHYMRINCWAYVIQWNRHCYTHLSFIFPCLLEDLPAPRYPLPLTGNIGISCLKHKLILFYR